MSRHTLEILAPAGDFERLRAAVFSGADSVYVGVAGFNARRSAVNFSGQALQQAVSFCHARNCKVYAALNVVVLPGQEAALDEAILDVARAGCDGVIVQDLAAAQRVHVLAPGLPLHASTQMSVHSLAGVQQLARLGFSRAILARELSLEEIRSIAQASPIELEVFIHGALCVCVSGQCSMSAFLGGRSANRGACAAPCRLPFRAQAAPADAVAYTGAKKGPAAETHHLSLKDLSLLDALPELEKIGITSGKIEGRLRTPEYVAVVVDAARKARDGRPYDENLLRNTFSRNGFTDGWFTGKNDRSMFGARTEDDAQASQKALAAAHTLYRREVPRVPVKMQFVADGKGASLTVNDGTNTVCQGIAERLVPATKDTAPALRTALAKTGGTPFFVQKEQDITVKTAGVFVPAVLAGALRRQALEELLRIREAPQDNIFPLLPTAKAGEPENAAGSTVLKTQRTASKARRQSMPPDAEKPMPALRARFETVAQMPPEALDSFEELLLPLAEAQQVPAEYRAKTWLWLPRVAFGAREAQLAAMIETTKGMGFRGYEVQNIAHLRLCAGLPMSAGVGLNCTNALAAQRLGTLGCGAVTLSPELSLRQMRQMTAHELVPQTVRLDALCYGRLPLMVTRACPLKQVTDCTNCTRCGWLHDRKGQAFPVRCREGVRVVHNPVPLWMADRLAEFSTDTATLYFTIESSEKAAEVLAAFVAGQPAKGAFTRGLYDRGTA